MFLLAARSFAASPTAWALSYEGKSTNQFVWDKRVLSLVRTRLPAKLSDAVMAGLGGPPDPVFVSSQRYVSVSACVPHNCTDKGFFWLDTATGIGLGAAFGYGDKLTLGSNGMPAAGIPQQARAALAAWIDEHGLKPAAVEFIDHAGAMSALPLAAFQPRARFEPPPGGPSFDCGGRLDAVEKAICGDAALKELDLELGQTFERMRLGQSTAGARQQLVDLQRTWLKNRNAHCASVPAKNDCLKAEYITQQDRLMNWVPALGR